jgi:hypothetical protein
MSNHEDEARDDDREQPGGAHPRNIKESDGAGGQVQGSQRITNQPGSGAGGSGGQGGGSQGGGGQGALKGGD